MLYSHPWLPSTVSLIGLCCLRLANRSKYRLVGTILCFFCPTASCHLCERPTPIALIRWRTHSGCQRSDTQGRKVNSTGVSERMRKHFGSEHLPRVATGVDRWWLSYCSDLALPHFTTVHSALVDKWEIVLRCGHFLIFCILFFAIHVLFSDWNIIWAILWPVALCFIFTWEIDSKIRWILIWELLWSRLI